MKIYVSIPLISTGLIVILIIGALLEYILTKNEIEEQTLDLNSFSNFQDIRSIHYDIDMKIDFTQKKIFGTINHTMLCYKSHLKRIAFDINHLVNIKVSVPNQSVKWKIKAPKGRLPILGQQLIVELEKHLQYREKIQINFKYETNYTEEATAINWLDPAQTSGSYPYLFTNCVPIFGRTVAPFQDTPSIKSTFTAYLTVDKDLTAYASGLQKKVIKGATTTTYYYEQPVPIPSYLFALAIGDIQKQSLSERVGILAEPPMLEKAVAELSDAPTFVDMAEEMLIPYKWTEYNILIMPSSFCFGGMENPDITFGSPSIIVGDKSEVSVITHEIAHSWTGNLVSISNFTDFWLKESITNFIERKIVEKHYGYEFYMSEAYLGRFYLYKEIETLGEHNILTMLCPDLSGLNPQQVINQVPYEKGFLFIKYLESLVGEQFHTTFLQMLLSTFEYGSISSKDFQNFFISFVSKKLSNSSDILAEIDWNNWYFGTGYPSWELNYTTHDITSALELANDYVKCNGTTPPSYSNYFKFYASQKVIFFIQLKELHQNLTISVLERIESDIKIIEKESNLEILSLWYQLVALKQAKEYFIYLDVFLGKTGRIKFIKTIYTYIAAYDKELALKYLKEHEKSYSSVAVNLIKELIERIDNMSAIKDPRINLD